ncbi:MAG: hypothetical protein RBU37_13365 [Myxococcota bacterium]|jgi:hypothetical protein|nr:hypothetical protein [Myxococcota bacterium]
MIRQLNRFLAVIAALGLLSWSCSDEDPPTTPIDQNEQSDEAEGDQEDDEIDLIDDTDVTPADTDVTEVEPDGDVTEVDVVGECDPVAESGCSGGMRCVLDFTTGAPTCIISSPTALPLGSPCTTERDDCANGLQCVSSDGVNGVCRDICHMSSMSGCTGEEKCRVKLPVSSAYGFCEAFDTCDVLTQDCPNEEACVGGRDPTYGLIFLCVPPGSLTQGETCVNVNDCAKGLTCIGIGGPKFCSQYCSESAAPSTCPETTQCRDGAALGFDGERSDVGVCY